MPECAASSTVWFYLVEWPRVIVAGLPLKRSIRILPKIGRERLWALLSSKVRHEFMFLLIALRKWVSNLRIEIGRLFTSLASIGYRLILKMGSRTI